MAELLYQDLLSEVWLGNCLDAADVKQVMGERKADLLCLDAPYSEKTHSGHAGGKATVDRCRDFAERNANATGNLGERARYAGRRAQSNESGRRDLDYPSWSMSDVESFCAKWMPLTSGWSVSITDDILAPIWGGEFEAHDRYRFAPLPLVETGSRVRMTGDGPSNWTCWLVVARPKHAPYSKWGALGGAYVLPGERELQRGVRERVVGGKPLGAMLSIVSDYSRRGDLVVDPTCGAGTTLMAAKMNGRRSIGIEMDRGRAELAARRLRKSHEQGNLFEVPA